MSLDRSTIWPYEDGRPGAFFYQRFAHPAGVEAERRLGELDGGTALLCSSGAGATTALVLGLARSGWTVAVARGIYYGTPQLLAELERFGVRTVEFDQTGPPPDGADLVWTEAPSNPYLTLPDLEAAAAHPGLLVVDATAATPVLLRPLAHGADVVLHSATKALAGHHDALVGALVFRDPELAERVRRFRGLAGLMSSPDAAWLLLRGLETLELRVRRSCETALELARRLQAHPAVERVRYPGLGDPLAERYLSGGYGALLSFDVAGAGEALAVERAVRRIENATSLGGTRTTIEARRRWEGERVPPGLLRLAVGLEDADVLWADLAAALEPLAQGRRAHRARA